MWMTGDPAQPSGGSPDIGTQYLLQALQLTRPGLRSRKIRFVPPAEVLTALLQQYNNGLVVQDNDNDPRQLVAIKHVF
jgi:hypothetical protein